ncbi:unnamed protein product [Dimorphilus gyrociliatus]|uniref:Uncharacterized protein n=1 Tax=Dimorphilus gyrociliatus TaxID=2664684 RepID=A0A7I8W9Q2_9ANNE|nr:unnamed protein product [Dimorphilus gyrociliatus]
MIRKDAYFSELYLILISDALLLDEVILDLECFKVTFLTRLPHASSTCSTTACNLILKYFRNILIRAPLVRMNVPITMRKRMALMMTSRQSGREELSDGE